MLNRILITPGEPSGIGPDIIIALAQQAWPIELIAIADPTLLVERAKQLGLPLNIHLSQLHLPAEAHQAGTLKVLPVKLFADVIPGQLNTANVNYVLQTLEQAAKLCLNKTAQALVTGPVHKGIINQAGKNFTGHTEFFAAQSHVQQTVMLFVAEQMKVALATTHLPLLRVSEKLTKDHLRKVLQTLLTGLQQQFQLANPCIIVCGLNPHAGEEGHLGKEEIETISPVLAEFRDKGYQIEGPFSADTLFTAKKLQQPNIVVLAMYHDQALPVVKYASFGHAVNVTLGLPFIRTSVDHGTALSIAGTGQADASSLKAALLLAIQLSQKHMQR